jgi:hypothetical protein
MTTQLSARSLSRSLLIPALVTGGFLAGACKGEIEGGEQPETKPTEVKKKSNIVKLTTAVPYGKHVDCADVFPDPAPFTAKLGETHEIGHINDKSKSNSAATFVCSLVKAGDPPESPKELKTLEDKYAKLGVLPGDEYCMVTAYCSLSSSAEDFEKKCETDGNQRSSLDGQFACLRATEKGVEYSYTYKFIEPDTKCTVEAMAGPSVNDENLVRNCALAARDIMTMESVANAK